MLINKPEMLDEIKEVFIMLKITKKGFVEIVRLIGNQIFSYSHSIDSWIIVNRQLGLKMLREAEKIEKLTSLPKHYEIDEFGTLINCH